MNNNTPETEARKFRVKPDEAPNYASYAVEVDFSRRLECQRNLLVEALQTIVDGDKGFGTWSGSQCVEIARAAISNLKNQPPYSVNFIATHRHRI